jgi:hypothetical protein
MAGLLFASFLAHFFGFIGPFAAMGVLFLIYAVFLNQMIEFMPPGSIMNGSATTHNENSTESEGVEMA